MATEQHEGHSKDGFSEAVRHALDEASKKSPGKKLTFRVVDHYGEWSANPGTINYTVRLDVDA
jgi:flavin-binding protein dodecin